jgi:hypothetical protein
MNNSTPMAPMAPINVLVHGLIFMRLSSGQTYLELVVPKLSEGSSNPHLFVLGVRHFLKAPNDPVTDWRDIGLYGSTADHVDPGQKPSNLKPSVLQFSISATGLDSWNSAYEDGKIYLRWPKRFSSIRCDYFDRAFLYAPTGRAGAIGDTIKENCRGKDPNAKTGLVTCLEYDYDPAVGVNIPGWQPGLNLHCCFEPLIKHSIDDVNEDLGQAASLFRYPQNFDLRMRPEAGSVITNPGELCPDSANGVQVGDDLSLGEGLDHALAQKKPSSPGTNRNVNPANCPNFFVGP